MAEGGDLLLHLMRLREAYGSDVLLPRGAPWTAPARSPAESTADPGPLAAAVNAPQQSNPEQSSPEQGNPEQPTPPAPPPAGRPAATRPPSTEVRREELPTSETVARSNPDKSPAPPPTSLVPEKDAASSLAELATQVAACERCDLCKTRTKTVFGEGDPSADVLFIGEAPGANEDRQGRPFCGPAGELLDRIIQNAMGLQRSEVYIANVNKCRPPGNRDPEPDEVAACLPFLRKQIEWIRPKVIVTLGRIAAHNLLGTTAPMRALRGRDLERHGVPVVATWHPAYLLRQPSAKRETWEDIKRVNRLLGRPEVPSRPGGPRS